MSQIAVTLAWIRRPQQGVLVQILPGNVVPISTFLTRGREFFGPFPSVVAVGPDTENQLLIHNRTLYLHQYQKLYWH